MNYTLYWVYFLMTMKPPESCNGAYFFSVFLIVCARAPTL